METAYLLHQISEVDSTASVVLGDKTIEVSNLMLGYKAKINPENILSTQFVLSPSGQKSIQLSFEEGIIIITPDDFVFDVVQDEIIVVRDLPSMCSIKELTIGIEEYLENPYPSNNIDLNTGLYFLQYYIIKSALRRGFSVENYKTKIEEIGKANDFFGLGPLELFD